MKNKQQNRISKSLTRFISCFLIIGLFSTVSIAQQCPPDQPGCTDWETFTATVSIPDYPECTLTVNYRVRVCQGIFQIADISFFTDVFACGALISDAFGVFFGGDQLAQERFNARLIAQVETEISNQLFEQARAGIPDALLLCGSGLETVTTNFYRGSCVSFCVSRDDDGSIGFNSISCGRTCCVKSIVYCIDPVSSQTVTTETSEPLNSAECFSLPIPSCPGNSLFQSPCFALCEN